MGLCKITKSIDDVMWDHDLVMDCTLINLGFGIFSFCNIQHEHCNFNKILVGGGGGLHGVGSHHVS